MADNSGFTDATPSNTSNVALGDDDLRSIKSFVRNFWDQEHYGPGDGGGTGASFNSVGVHKHGSARAWNQSAAPTAVNPTGQLWRDTDDGVFYIANAAGTGDWQVLSDATQGSANTWAAANYFENTVTLEVTSYISDSANANMGLGLTINQHANDDEILAFKSSDIAHGMTALAETDTYGAFTKVTPTGGGTEVNGWTEATVGVALRGAQTTQNNNQTTAGRAAVECEGTLRSGTGETALTAGNVWGVRNNGTAEFLVDEAGNFHYNGADGGAFDSHDDSALLRAFALVTSAKDVIRSKWDEFVSYNENDLIALGILGAPVAEGGLVNGAQLQRLLVGDAWQSAVERKEMRAEIESLKDELKLLKA